MTENPINPEKADEKQKRDNNNLTIQKQPGKTSAAMKAELALGGIINGAALVQKFSTIAELSITDCFESLTDKAKAVHGGDLKDAESMLTAQAMALDTIFVFLVLRAKMNLDDYPDAFEKYMKLALKTQGQCRTTLETLAMMKNPQPYIRQQNLANQQIINNGQPFAHGENLKQANELLKDRQGEYETLDTGGTAATAGTDPELEAVAVVNGRKDS